MLNLVNCTFRKGVSHLNANNGQMPLTMNFGLQPQMYIFYLLFFGLQLHKLFFIADFFIHHLRVAFTSNIK